MATLSNILSDKTAPFSVEENLELGEVYAYTVGVGDGSTGGTAATANFCWNAPGIGKAVIEVWGAGGSSGKMCCCGAGIGGNPGAYSKRTVNVDGSTWIRGFIGNSCSNNDLCFKGCSQSSCITVCSPNGTLTGPTGNSTCFCICAQGGVGGVTWCNGSTQPYCCHRANGMCASQPSCGCFSSGCGLICNVGFHSGRCAYGGDVNCNSGAPDDSGNFTCVSMMRCYPCRCTMQDHIAIPPGIIAEGGAVLTYPRECYSMQTGGTGDGLNQIVGMLAGAARRGGTYMTTAQCWNSNRTCGCYEHNHCYGYLPPAVPAQGSMTASSVRDYGSRGGPGLVRIKFIGS